MKDTLKLKLKANAFAIALGSFAVGTGSSLLGLYGYFDTRISYCDTYTTPCTPVTVPYWYKQTLVDAQKIKVTPGTGLLRTLGSIGGSLAFSIAMIAALVAADNQRHIDEETFQQETLAATQNNILADEQVQKWILAASLRVMDFRRELYDGYSLLYLQQHPELVEVLTANAHQFIDVKAQDVASASNNEADADENEKNLAEKEDKNTAEHSEDASNLVLGVELPTPPDIPGIVFFDWRNFRTNPDDYTHVRIVAPTNGGKTSLADWLLDVFPSDERFVITIKQKPHQWQDLTVIGVPEDYEAVHFKLEWLESQRKQRTALMAKGEGFSRLNVAVDEWRAIARHCKAKKDPETKEIVRQSATAIMGDTITLAREVLIRVFALAQGRQVATWGVEGESDLLECFMSIYMGQFAVEEALTIRNQYAGDSIEYGAWLAVVEYLKSLGKRAAFVESELGRFPAVVPDLSRWRRGVDEVGLGDELQISSSMAVGEVMARGEVSPPGTDDDEKALDEKADDPKADETDSPDDLWRRAVERLEQSWAGQNLPSTSPLEDTSPPPENTLPPENNTSLPTSLGGEVTSPPKENTSPKDGDSAGDSEVSDDKSEVGEVRNEDADNDGEVLPALERSRALTRALGLLQDKKSDEVGEVIALIPTHPDKALWLALRVLGLKVTPASRDVFGCGTGGKAFVEKAKPWYEGLEKAFGKICDG